MRKSQPYLPVVLMLTLVIPAVMVVSVSPRNTSDNRAAVAAPAQEPLVGSMPAQSAAGSVGSSFDAYVSGIKGNGGYLAGNRLPAADALGLEEVAALGVPVASDDPVPPAEEDCKDCEDRPRRTRTPRPQQNDPTPTVEVQPTGTPVPPTRTPVPPTNTPVPPPPTSTPLPLATTTAVPNYHNPSPAVVSAEARMYQLINAHRASIGKNQWVRVTALDLAQRDWALQMVVTNDCRHGDYGGRAAQQGYSGFAWGEVGACGYPNADEAFQGWLDSPGHRGIIEAGNDMNEIGIGAWQYPNGYFQFWALVADRD